MRARVPVLLLLLLLVVPFANATISSDKSSAGSISGTVKDPSGAVLPGSQIALEPGAAKTAADAQGNFVIQNLKPGTYTVTISAVGFATNVSTVVVNAGANALVNTTLKLASTSQQVAVNGSLEGDVAAINEQRTSENILNVTTADTIQNLPNQSVATVLGRMPGVTVQINEGEAQYVQIRGTEPRLSNTTVDGVSVPGPDPQVRQVDLWVIPGDLVGSIDINKTLSANQDGDAIGGSVNLHVRQATSSRPTLDFESLGGWNPIDTGQPWFRDDATVGKRFGAHQRFGAIFSFSYDLNDLGTDDVEPLPDVNPDGSNAPYFDTIALNEYFYNHTRYGFGGSMDYKISDNSDLFVHGIFSNFKDYGQKYEYDIGNSANGNAGVSFHNSLRRPNYQISDLFLGGNHVFTHSFIHYVAAISHSREGGAAGNPGADYTPLNSNLGSTCTYVPGPSIYRPQFPCAANDPIYDPTQYALQDINLTTGQSSQLNLQASGSVGLNYHLGSHASTFEFGALIRNAHKGQYAFSPTYDCNPQTDDQVNNGTSPCSANANPLMSQFTTNFTNPSFYGGSYKYGPVTSFESTEKWLAANPGVLPLDEPETHLNSDPANYNLQERITAGYIMNTVDLGSRFHLQTGLRIEATNESNTGYLVINDSDGIYISTQAVNGGGSYINPLPSVQLRYGIDQNSDLRAVFGMGISRPDPYELVPYKTLDETKQPNVENIGNPALVAEHADDYDLLYERFLPSVGMIEAGYFYKHLTKPLFQTETEVPNPFPNPVTPTVLLTQWINGGHAYVEGIEFAYQQHLSFLPGALGHAQINANMTWTRSKNYDIPNRTDAPQLVGQAPFSYNITPTYETKRATVSVGISYNGPNIASYQWQNEGSNAVPGPVNGPFGDNYYFERTQVDAQASYYLGKGFTITASEENANNAILGFYNGSKQYMTQREYYKPIYYGGIRWTQHHE
ncbi:TonB-dependent receptor [Acidicapsa dinghuensis]|uniref:TonB-dependent receptor n=1 Tax=Acidicapsa dinghuensis TaxID=2218256 RepID=A0ABW1EHK9_9BACT|nr:TonB-dependent receptor [Acidicapsa dinghuensis]